MASMKVYLALYFVAAAYVVACRGVENLGYIKGPVHFLTLQNLNGFHFILASEWFPMLNISSFIH